MDQNNSIPAFQGLASPQVILLLNIYLKKTFKHVYGCHIKSVKDLLTKSNKKGFGENCTFVSPSVILFHTAAVSKITHSLLPTCKCVLSSLLSSFSLYH